jgi:hypothetical protein
MKRLQGTQEKSQRQANVLCMFKNVLCTFTNLAVHVYVYRRVVHVYVYRRVVHVYVYRRVVHVYFFTNVLCTFTNGQEKTQRQARTDSKAGKKKKSQSEN